MINRGIWKFYGLEGGLECGTRASPTHAHSKAPDDALSGKHVGDDVAFAGRKDDEGRDSRTGLRPWMCGAPDVRRATDDYGVLASVYDDETRWIDAVRESAVARLLLDPGHVVADIACGTGFCLPSLSRAVGPTGRVIGVELSGDMVAVAQSRSAQLTNVELLWCPAHKAQLPVAPDAVLFSFAHDVLQSHSALQRILIQAKVGARVVAVGSKLFPWWLAPRNLWFLAGERGYVTTYRGFSRPWRLLARYLDEVTVQAISPGNKYIVTGRIRRPQLFGVSQTQ